MNNFFKRAFPFVLLLLAGCGDEVNEVLEWKQRYESVMEAKEQLERELDAVNQAYAELQRENDHLKESYDELISEQDELKKQLRAYENATERMYD